MFRRDDACGSRRIPEVERVSDPRCFVAQERNSPADEVILAHQRLYPVKTGAPLFVDPVHAEQRQRFANAGIVDYSAVVELEISVHRASVAAFTGLSYINQTLMRN